MDCLIFRFPFQASVICVNDSYMNQTYEFEPSKWMDWIFPLNDSTYP